MDSYSPVELFKTSCVALVMLTCTPATMLTVGISKCEPCVFVVREAWNKVNHSQMSPATNGRLLKRLISFISLNMLKLNLYF